MSNTDNSASALQDLFGANSWFVDYLYEQYRRNPDEIPPQWRSYFDGPPANAGNPHAGNGQAIKYPAPLPADEVKAIAGSAARILENMEASLTIPVATSQRVIPVKLLEENRLLINNYLKKSTGVKVSFTHIIAWAVVQALKKHFALNNAYSVVNGKPTLFKRAGVNIGIAIDVERKDGSRSLLVPNIKDAHILNFRQFLAKYEDLVKRSRAGQIDPAEFAGSTVTLTNPGTIGTVTSIPRLMVGQGTIIATGAIQYPAEYQAMAPDTISRLGISKVLTISSTYDHRIIQGAESGLFLKEIHEQLLGSNGFYDAIFTSLSIPLKPVVWQTDVHPEGSGGIHNLEEHEKQARVLQLINMYRVRGHLVANIDPLGAKPVYHAELDLAFHKLTMWDLDRTFITGGFGGLRTATLRQILERLQHTYCEKVGVEYMHIQNHEEKQWLQNQMESVENRFEFWDDVKKRILSKLIQAEEFEHFIHNKFVGHKRFSLEGSETLIPVLDRLLDIAADDGVAEIVLGMAHRGRLNVLANILGKSFSSIFSEFEDIVDPNSIQGSGDVKYHLGASGTYTTLSGRQINVAIAPNPSHLEWVDPVVEGIVRAKQTRNSDESRNKTIPVLIHGDGAFAGQGVVAETLNLSQLKGYRTGGTVHIITNNQIGFTTTAEDARSSQYATDVAKMVQAPIFHVNGDDPESALWVIQLAFMYRQKYHKDVVVDVLGYRRHGHNEGDEPGFTQPLMYEKIKSHQSVLSLYAARLAKAGVVSADEFAALTASFRATLEVALEQVKKKKSSANNFNVDFPLAVSSEKIKAVRHTHKTRIAEEVLNDIVNRVTAVPESFAVHPKLRKFLDKRREMLQPDGMADWATGEALAFASLLLEGTPVRLSGQDSVRGTFSQRHLSLTDMRTGDEYFPIKHMHSAQANLEALDSLLSEAAVLGFEYGYSTADPLTLVLWEAQFGDFANGAQIIIDNFIVASFEKWGVPANLVLLLPHGFEGQGPEHSSARLERFLTLCAQENMEVCYPSSPAQYFHLLRRHMKKGITRPLIIMTPKSLLRLPEARSSRNDFIHGSFKEVIDDAAITDKSAVTRIVLTSGKIYYELHKFRSEQNIADTAILRLEQFYPFEEPLLKEVLAAYPNAANLYWVQEEPKNMGAWSFLHERLVAVLKEGQRLEYIGRPASASPAVGSSKIAGQQQLSILSRALGKA